MKLHLFFLAIYMIMLPLLPCADAQECEEMAMIDPASAPNHEEHNESEACTPFCYCACCSVASGYTISPLPHAPREIFYAEFFTAEVQLSAIDLHSIWQPPRNC